MNDARKPAIRKTIVAGLGVLILLEMFYASDSWSADRSVIYRKNKARAAAHDGLSVAAGEPLAPSKEFVMCGREAKFHPTSWPRQQKYHTCPEYSKQKLPLVVTGKKGYGGSGNRLKAFLNAVQYARDKKAPLVVMSNSWAIKAVTSRFFVTGDREWQSRMERSLCLRIATAKPRRTRRHLSPYQLFHYKSTAPTEEYVASQLQIIRTLLRHHNTGMEHEAPDRVVRGGDGSDTCSGIDALFATDGAGDRERQRREARYSVVHLRSFEGNGKKILAKAAKTRGCDPAAAQEMRPEYVKSILAPLGMLQHPVIVVSDHEKGSKPVLARLLRDPDIGPMVQEVPTEARWFGGDMTLAVMANVFIGHPSSTMSSFIARSRAAIGLGNSYLCLAKDEGDEWSRVGGLLGTGTMWD